MPLKKNTQPRNLQGIALILVLAIAVGLLLMRQGQGAPALTVSLPVAQASPTPQPPSWQDVLQQQVLANATPVPQPLLPTDDHTPPTLAPINPAAPVILEPGQLEGAAATTAPHALTTRQEAAAPGSLEVVSAAGRGEVSWQPPPMIGPISVDPRDHYWFARPVDSDAVNYGLFYYSFGSDGPDDLWRVHHGLDMPNPIGESVRAAGPGTVVWAANGFRVEQPDGTVTETTYSYGNTVLIEHDFGYRGMRLFTLYAHLSSILVTRGQRVETGDIIGLVGDTGVVTGSHVHFEVRLGQNSYYAVHNPILWMVPYAGHGTIAGRVIGPDGDVLDDADISIIDRATGRVVRTGAAYVRQDINRDHKPDINFDPVWNENFAVGDIPEGRYQVVTRIDGVRVSRTVDVHEGTTTFVELALPHEATPEVPPQAEAS